MIWTFSVTNKPVVLTEFDKVIVYWPLIENTKTTDIVSNDIY